ncbi:MAG: hydrolase [Acidimicrobiia bacterium]|nr:MAG: hydrolase [Acidimicrobiia bacterium]
MADRTDPWRRIAAVAAALGALAACSGDDGAAGDPEPGTSTAAPATTTTVPATEVGAAPSGGCGGATAPPPGESTVTTTSGGVERTYVRHVPPAHDGTTPVPVVVDFHGYAEGAAVHVLMSGLGPYGDEQGFVTITPQGLGAVPRWDVQTGSADLAFFGDLLAEIGRTLCVDTNRVYVTGLSNGAFMTSAVACAYADRVAAVAPVAGIRAIEGCDPARAVPVVAFHGTADGFVTYDGSLGEAALDLPAPDGSGRTLRDLVEAGEVPPREAQGPSVPETTAAWAERNGCAAGEPAEEQVASDVTRLAWDCPPGAEVVLYRVEGGGHSWPGSEFSRSIEAVIGPTTSSISANEEMWAFFEEHPLRP